MTMPRVVDNARTAKIHEDGLMTLVSLPVAPRLEEYLLQAHAMPLPSVRASNLILSMFWHNWWDFHVYLLVGDEVLAHFFGASLVPDALEGGDESSWCEGRI